MIFHQIHSPLRVYKFFYLSSSHATQNILAHIRILIQTYIYIHHSYHFYQTVVIQISDSIHFYLKKYINSFISLPLTLHRIY